MRYIHLHVHDVSLPLYEVVVVVFVGEGGLTIYNLQRLQIYRMKFPTEAYSFNSFQIDLINSVYSKNRNTMQFCDRLCCITKHKHLTITPPTLACRIAVLAHQYSTQPSHCFRIGSAKGRKTLVQVSIRDLVLRARLDVLFIV